MHPLVLPAAIERNVGKDSSLVLYVCHSFDESFSFRELLNSIGSSGQDADAMQFELPAEQPKEDFVSGYATWRGTRFGLYYERSLGYMQFDSENANQIEALAAFLAPHFEVIKQKRSSAPWWLRWLNQ